MSTDAKEIVSVLTLDTENTIRPRYDWRSAVAVEKMPTETETELLEALEVAYEIVKALLPMQIKYGSGIGPREQADLDQIRNAIVKAKARG